MKKWWQFSPLQNIMLGTLGFQRFYQELCIHAGACTLDSQSQENLQGEGNISKQQMM